MRGLSLDVRYSSFEKSEGQKMTSKGVQLLLDCCKKFKRGENSHLRFFARAYTIKSWAVYLADESRGKIL